ncbi:xylanase A, partial [Coprinopsis marcescibilis]
ATITNLEGGTYSLAWSGNNGTLFGGKGWNPGVSERVVKYSGSFIPDGNSDLSLRGWTRKVEYYIVEFYGTRNPAFTARRKGSVTCNGAKYDILSAWRHKKPSIEGTQTFRQSWSVRTPKQALGEEVSGSVDNQCHVGMKIGSQHDYQLVATKSHRGSESAQITIS